MGIAPARERNARVFRDTLPAWFVFAVSICVTALAWYLSNAGAEREARQRFEAETRSVQTDLADRLSDYEQVLRGGVSTFHSWSTINRENWRSYVRNLHIAKRYPGIQGIGFAKVIAPADLDDHVFGVRAQGFPEFTVWPEGEREVYTSILYLEPFDWRNRRAFGYDMFQDPVRRAAMERARDSGLASLSGKVTLVQETNEAVQAGFLMYLPVYETPSPGGVAERRRQLKGYVYSPFRTDDFMRGLQDSGDRNVALQIFDGETAEEGALLYSLRFSARQFQKAPFTATVPLALGGRTWTLRFAALPALSPARGAPLAVAVGGLLVSFLLWAVAWSLARNRAHAAAANAQLEADIARRKRTEAQLREAETGFRYLFEKNPNPMWVFDRDSLEILEVNDAATAHYGWSREEFRRMKISDLRPAEDVPRLEWHVQNRAAGLTDASEWRHYTRDGRILDVEVSGYSLEFRRHRAALVVVRDITESKRAEEALKDSEAAARGVLDAALDAYVRIDQEGIIREWNSMAEQTFGWGRDEVIGRPLDEIIIPPEQRRAHRHGLKRFLTTREGPLLNRRIELQSLHRSGRTVPVEIAILALKTRSGHAFSAFLRDLTRKKLNEEKLRHAQKMEAVGKLTGGVAHDFNNLLTVVIGNLDLAAMHASEGTPAAESIQYALQAAEKGAALTHRLLAFSRQQTLQPVPTDLNELVGSMTELLERTLGEDIAIEVSLYEKLWPELADKSQVESALLNLAINARDAMPHGGTLTIETGNVSLDAEYAARHAELQPGDYVMLAVTDTGIGMSPDVVERAIDPFFTTKEVGKGSGLGLSMIYGFAKQSGGHLAIYSEVGHGTTVRFYLPRAASSQPEGSAAVAAGEVPRGSETILVVEDEEAVRRFVVTSLRRLGYRLFEAGDSMRAMEILESDEPIDLLFTDVVLPGGKTGRQLAEEMHELRPEMRVLFTSGYTENALTQANPGPGLRLLSKPYRSEDLARKVREVLRSGPEAVTTSEVSSKPGRPARRG